MDEPYAASELRDDSDDGDEEGGAPAATASRWLYDHLGCWLRFRRHVFHPWMMDGQYRWKVCRHCPVSWWSPQ
jgi:hypothetical protein